MPDLIVYQHELIFYNRHPATVSHVISFIAFVTTANLSVLAPGEE